MLQRFPFFFFFPSSCCGKSLRRCQFLFFYFRKEKRKRRSTQHASLNTNCATRFMQHNTRYLAKAQQQAQRATGPERLGESSELCDGGLKVIQRDKGVGERSKKEERERSCAPQARLSPSHYAAGGGTSANSAESEGAGKTGRPQRALRC